MSSIKELRDKLKNKKNLTTYDEEELKFLQTTTGKALFNHKSEEEPKEKVQEKRKAKWSDRIECDICGKVFTRSARSSHNITLFHRMKRDEHAKLKKLLID